MKLLQLFCSVFLMTHSYAILMAADMVSSSQVQVTLQAENRSSEIKANQRVPIKVVVKNLSNEKGLVLDRLLAPIAWDEFDLHVRGPSGKEIALRRERPAGGSAQVLWIKPKESGEFTFDLDGFIKPKEPGIYEVSLKLGIGVKGEPNTSIKAESNTLRLSVIP